MALLMDSKVVKVWDIDSPPEEQSYLLPDSSTSESNEIVLDQFTWRPTSQLSVCPGGWSVYHDDDLVKTVSEELELPEESGAPDNWPQIPQLSRRRSCETSGERTNCVNKAVEHLQLLLDILTEWVQKTEEKVSEDTDVDPKLSVYFDPTDKEDTLVPLTTYFVPLASAKALKYYNNHAQLKAVVKEVMLLLAWLHDDCQKTEAKLYSEKTLKSQLSSEIDEMYQQKFIDITARVQKEHDIIRKKMSPFMEKITDLRCARANYQNKLKSVQNVNFKLKKSIAKSEKQIPLMQQKILQENQQIEELQNALNDAEKILSETLEKKAAINSKYQENLEIIKEEQYGLDLQLNDVCHEFNVISEAAVKAEKNYYAMSKGIVDSKEQIANNEKEAMVLKVKFENSKTKSNSIEILSFDEKSGLVHQVKESKQLKKQNKKLSKDIGAKKNELFAKMEEQDKEMLKLQMEYKSLMDYNNEKINKIESMQIKIDGSKKQKTFYEENLKQTIDDIMRTESQVTLISDELNQIQGASITLSKKVDQKQLMFLEKKKSLESTVKDIKKEIVSENNAYLELADKVTDLEFETRSIQADAMKQKEKYQIKVDESKASLGKLTEKLNNLVSLNEQKKQELAELDEKKMKLRERYKKAVQDHEGYLINLIPFQQKSEERGRELEWKLNELMNQLEKLKTEIKMMIKEGKSLELLMIETNEKIAELKEEIQEINFPIEAVCKHLLITRTRLRQVNERLNQEWRDHDDLMHCREATLEDILQKKQQCLEENKQLASKYRRAQNTLLQSRKQYVQLSEDTILLKRALNDLKQLLKLQTKVQHCQKNYYQYRMLYNSKQLAYFVNFSEGDQDKIKQLRSVFESKMRIMINNVTEIISMVFSSRPNFLPGIIQPID